MSTLLVVYLAAAAGVAISVILPLIRAALPKPPAMLATASRSWWEVARPYVATAAFSAIVALLIVASNEDLTWRTALFAGYAVDSTLQKMTTGNTGTV